MDYDLNQKIIEYSSNAEAHRFKIPRYNIYFDDSLQRKHSEQAEKSNKWKHLIIPENMMVKYYSSKNDTVMLKLRKLQIKYFESYFYNIVKRYLRKNLEEDGIFVLGCNFS